MIETVDVIVIGAGQAGPSLAVRFAQAGRRVVLIERERLGGTCVNNGCIPTKTLVASARAAHVARRAADFGVSTGPVSVDLALVKARKDAEKARERDRPGAQALPLVAALQVPGVGGGGGGPPGGAHTRRDGARAQRAGGAGRRV